MPNWTTKKSFYYEEIVLSPNREKARAETTDLSQVFSSKLNELGLTPETCLLHFHNHGLGKNWQVNRLIKQLQDSGFRMLLQIHDFAEDSRPDNYRRLKLQADSDSVNLLDFLYPNAAHVEFGMTNHRDGQNLKRIGVTDDRIHYLPNPVSAFDDMKSQVEAKNRLESVCASMGVDFSPRQPLLVYPVRGIRRKNIGEAVLLSLVAEQPIQIAITLPPPNPSETQSYEAWKSICSKLRLLILFEVGTFSCGITRIEETKDWSMSFRSMPVKMLPGEPSTSSKSNRP